MAELRQSHKCNRKPMSSTFIISENEVLLWRDSKISRPYWRFAVVESVIVSKDNKVVGAKARLLKSNVLERPINMLYPIEATKINNANKSHSPLEKGNKPVIDFVVDNIDFRFDKTVMKNDNAVKPSSVVIKPDDDNDMKDEGKHRREWR